ncbi:BREX system ATP-binding domain-containing protein [Methanobrevibacter woesei]|uniref:BREX system ATP-binding domain-containing protein n=1 Tax=Methanobrevibacter woesei TaxID=190976 RepID=UPI0039F5E70B
MDYENILMALKNGNVPEKGVKNLCIGREKEIDEFEKLLDKVNNKKAVVKFINGEFGAGKSFFLKVIEEMAYDKNFVVSWITLSNDVPFNKIDIVYKNIVKSLKCKTGTSLSHIIDRWITELKMMAFEQTSNPQKQNQLVQESIYDDLAETREHASAFAMAIESYNKLMNEEDYKTAEYAKAWLRGDSNIPYTEKRKFGVKGDVTKDNAIHFLEALSIFVKSIGYSGLVVLIDEAEFTMNLHTKKLRDVAYNYMRDIYDNCNLGKFENSLFVFAATPELFDNAQKGIPSYEALDDRLKDVLDTDLPDMRKPIFNLKGFEKEDLLDVAGKLLIMHEEVYKWNANDKINPVLNDIVEIHAENAGLTGGKVTPRTFIRSFVSLLDTVQQNQSYFKDSNEILNLFNDRESELNEENFNALDEFDDDW